MNRIIAFLIIILSFTSSLCYSQSAIWTMSGKTVDKLTGELLYPVTCKVTDAKGKMLSYVLTDDQGRFSLSLDNRAVQVTFSMIGYSQQTIKVPKTTQDFIVEMRRQSTMLKEITVKIKPIEIHHDTINYNVSAFKDKNDRYIEDVLKKLPGIEVSDDGRVSYQGKSINKFNIEGQDLLGNQYNQATRNLTADAVAQIQIMENDQPIRALKGKVMSDKATLNIRLKQGYKAKPFGELSVGIGYGEELLWNNHATVINISKKNQLLITAKMNNSGERLDENTMEHIDVTDLDSYEPTPVCWIVNHSNVALPISKSRYFDNKSYSVGINHLLRLSEYSNLRTNITYYESHDNYNDSTYNEYGGMTPISVFEKNVGDNHERTIIPRLKYEWNGSTCFLSDECAASLSFVKRDEILYNNNTLLDNNYQSKPFWIQNRLQLTLSTRSHVFQIRSFVRYFRRSEIYQTDDTATAIVNYSGWEKIALNRFKSQNSVSSVWNIWGNELSLKYSLAYLNDGLGLNNGKYMHSGYLKNSITPGCTFKYSNGFLSLDLPVTYLSDFISWKETDKNSARLYLNPSIRWTHQFTPLWKVSLRAAEDDRLSDNTPFQGKYLSDYRTEIEGLDRYGWNKSKSVSFSLNYANMINMLSWSLMASASWLNVNHDNYFLYTDVNTIMSPVWMNVDSRRIFILSSIEKAWHDTGFSIKGSVSYNRTELPFRQNDIEQTIKSNICSTVLSFRWNKLSWIQLQNQTTVNVSWQDYYNYSYSAALLSVYDIAKMYIHVAPKTTAGITLEKSIVEISAKKFNVNTFLDCNVRFDISKNILLDCRISNLFNRKEYIEANYTGLNYHYYMRPLRGREVLCSLVLKMN